MQLATRVMDDDFDSLALVRMKLMNSSTISMTCLVTAFLLNPPIARADAVLEWNAIMVTMVSDQPPPFQNRFAATTHLAMFEAVNAVTGEFKPYLGTVTAPRSASADAAAIAAAHMVLKELFSESRANPG